MVTAYKNVLPHVAEVTTGQQRVTNQEQEKASRNNAHLRLAALRGFVADAAAMLIACGTGGRIFATSQARRYWLRYSHRCDHIFDHAQKCRSVASTTLRAACRPDPRGLLTHAFRFWRSTRESLREMAPQQATRLQITSYTRSAPNGYSNSVSPVPLSCLASETRL